LTAKADGRTKRPARASNALLAPIATRGFDRLFVSIGGADQRDRIAGLARAAQAVA
jgi:hypothetical protein